MKNIYKNWSVRLALVGLVSLNIYGIIGSFENPAYLYLLSLMVISFIFGFIERQIELTGSITEFSFDDIKSDETNNDSYKPDFLSEDDESSFK